MGENRTKPGANLLRKWESSIKFLLGRGLAFFSLPLCRFRIPFSNDRFPFAFLRRLGWSRPYDDEATVAKVYGETTRSEGVKRPESRHPCLSKVLIGTWGGVGAFRLLLFFLLLKRSFYTANYQPRGCGGRFVLCFLLHGDPPLGRLKDARFCTLLRSQNPKYHQFTLTCRPNVLL